VTHANFAGLADGRGIEFKPVDSDFRAELHGEDGQRMLASGRNPVAAFRAARAIAARRGREWWTQVRDLSAGVDAVVTETTTFSLGASLAERWGIPWINGFLAPMAPTRAFPSPILPPPAVRLPGWANLLQHHVATQIIWQVFRRSTDDLRRDVLGLGRWPRTGPFAQFGRECRPVLMAFSEHMVPRPLDWDARLEMTGYWFLDRPLNWTPPADLVRFMEAGPAPVYAGFGSMGMADPEHTGTVVVDAIGKVGCRAVIAAGWAGLRARLPGDDIFVVDELPHDWLFPRVAAVVHHGGAGTTAAAARAGVPSVPVPFMVDQFFWAWRLKQLGLAPAAIPHRKLTAGALAAALRQALDDREMRRRASELGAHIRAEDGVARAVDKIERVALERTLKQAQ
jgi:UDP:flavonoid glycosyltransferase YjiC (YdhE family)